MHLNIHIKTHNITDLHEPFEIKEEQIDNNITDLHFPVEIKDKQMDNEIKIEIKEESIDNTYSDIDDLSESHNQ